MDARDQRSSPANSSFGEYQIEGVQHPRQEEEETEDQVDDGLFAGIGFQVNGQRR